MQTDPSGRYSDRFSRFEDCDVPFWKSVFTGAAAVLEKNPNMYADLSGLIEGAFETETFIKDQSGYLEILKSWMHYVSDYGKFIYGTDWPAVNCFEYREFIKRLVPEQYHEKVFYENAVRVYGLV